MKVLIYARFSGSKQQHGNSVERQIEMCEAFAKANGLTATEPPLIDRGRSAYKAAHVRGQMGQLLRRAKSGDLGEGDIILVEMIDRMSREKVMKAWDQLRVFTNAGITIITVANGTRLNEETFEEQWTRMIDPLAQMAGAHGQSADKAVRTTDNWKRARAAGVKMTTALPGWLNQDKTVRPKRVKTVQTIFDLYLQGYGAGVITKKLNADPEHPAWGNGRKDTYSVWSSATVAKVLNSRAVIGEYQPRSGGQIVGPVVSDYFPEVISPEVFLKAQAIKKGRKFGGLGSGRRASDGANIFRGLALCGLCRRRMNVTHGGGIRSLRCYGSRTGSCSNNRGFNYDKLEEAVLRTVSELQLSETGSSARLRGLKSEIASIRIDIETAQGNVDFLMRQLLTTKSAAMSKAVIDEEAKLVDLNERLMTMMAEFASQNSPLSDHQREVDSGWKILDLAQDKSEVRQRINAALTGLVDKIVMTANHNVMIHFKDHTVYVLRYRLKASLAKRKRVGSRPISDYEWYAGRVGGQEMIDAWAASFSEHSSDDSEFSPTSLT